MIYKAIVIHNEQPVREHLKLLLEENSSVIRFIAEAENYEHVIKKIESLKPDVLYLNPDIKSIKAYAIVKLLTFVPHIIFVTDSDRYAVKAFEYGAFDYLVLPIRPARFASSIKRLQKFNGAVGSYQNEHSNNKILCQSYFNRIQVRTGNEIRFLPVQDIVFFEAEDYYSAVNTAGSRYLIRYSLTELEHRLLPDHFIRIHRSFIVNISHIKKLHTTLNGTQIIVDTLRSEPLSISRRYLKRVKEVLSSEVYL